MERTIFLLIFMFVSCYGGDSLSYRNGNFTYTIFSKYLTWDVAAKSCSLKGLELFYPTNQVELRIAKKLMKDMDVKFIFVGVTSKENHGVFKTIDGINTNDVFGKWGVGEPNNVGGKEQCVVLRDDGTYNDDNCAHLFPYICRESRSQINAGRNNINVSAENSKEKFFRSDYKYLGHKNSFYKAHPVARQWESARRKCIMEGATLFYPEDDIEVNEVIRYLNQSQPWFQYMFIGISTRLASGVYMTVDGKPIRKVYNEWYRKTPSGANGRNSCVTLSREGFLNDIKCSEERPFVCKKTAASIEWSSDCNIPYKDYKYNVNTGSCYKFHLQRLNWREALEACDDEQAQLAIINTAEEANYLVNITNNSPMEMVRGWYLCPYVHLGYNYDATENSWRTIKGESLEKAGYAVWDNYYEDGAGERCGAMLYNGRLNDVNCEDIKCFFVCETNYYTHVNVTAGFRK